MDPGDVINPSGEQNLAGDACLRLSGSETSALVDSVQTWRYSVDSRQWGFFLAKRRRDGHSGTLDRNSASADVAANDQRPTTPGTPAIIADHDWTVGSLASYERGFFEGVDPDDRFVCFADPSTYPSYPGWMLRNLLVLVRRRWKIEIVQILCYRDIQSRRDDARSVVLRLELGQRTPPLTISTEDTLISQSGLPKVTGWERNSGGKVTSKIANLGEYMDPQRYGTPQRMPIRSILTLVTRLADQAVDLNLKLIKWRIAPSLDLERIKNTKCLLLGAGTLGSYVARNLMVR